MAWREGEKIGQYVLNEMLGQGGMATVYKAYHESLDRYVAIKVMHQNFLDDDTFIARFRRESQLVAKLTHPHIVPVYDFGEHEKRPYLVMKYIEGETLKHRMIIQALSLQEILKIMTAVGSALTYAHSQDILHRDIKPSNIVIDKDDTPYLADFGLARLASSGESTMSADMLLGTPHYISPEQAKGEKKIDGRADIYSLGIVLYEILVGQVPFTADTPYAIIHDHIYSPLPSPSKLNPEIPPAVEEVLHRALEKKPDNRYGTADEMVQDLRDAIEESNLKELDPKRVSMASASLAKIRAEAPQGVVTGSPPPQRTVYVHSSANIPQGLTASLAASPSLAKRWHQDERIWPVSGCASLLLVCFLGLVVLLNMSTNIIELVTLTTTGEFHMGMAEGRRAGIIISEYEDLGVVYNASLASYEIPLISLEEAQAFQEAFPDNPITYLLLAHATGVENRDQEVGANIILSGLPYTEDVALYLFSAARLAEENGYAQGAVMLRMLSLEAAMDTDLFPRVRENATEYIYEHIADLGNFDLQNLFAEATAANLSQYGIEINIEESFALRYGMVRYLISQERYPAARAILAQINLAENNPLEEEFALLQGELEAQAGNTIRARATLEGILELESSFPHWIRERAEELLNEL